MQEWKQLGHAVEFGFQRGSAPDQRPAETGEILPLARLAGVYLFDQGLGVVLGLFQTNLFSGGRHCCVAFAETAHSCATKDFWFAQNQGFG